MWRKEKEEASPSIDHISLGEPVSKQKTGPLDLDEELPADTLFPAVARSLYFRAMSD